MKIFKSLLLVGGVMLTFSFNETSALANTNTDIIADIKSNMSQDDFNALAENYSENEIISIISEEVNNTILGEEIEFEYAIDLNSDLRRTMPEVETVNLVTESGYEFEVRSTLLPSLQKSFNGGGNYAYDKSHQHKIESTAIWFPDLDLTTKFTVSPNKITGDSNSTVCRAAGFAKCTSEASEILSHSSADYYSSFRSYATFGGEVSIAGPDEGPGATTHMSHNIKAIYGVTSYSPSNKTVYVKITASIY